MDDHDITAARPPSPPADLDPRPHADAGPGHRRERCVTGVRPGRACPSRRPAARCDVEGLVGHLVAVVDRIEALGRRRRRGEVPTRGAGAARRAAQPAGTTAPPRPPSPPGPTTPSSTPRPGAVGHAARAATPWRSTSTSSRSTPGTSPGPPTAHPCGTPTCWPLSTAAIHQQLPSAERRPMWAEFAAHLPPEVPFDPPFGDAVAGAGRRARDRPPGGLERPPPLTTTSVAHVVRSCLTG